MFEKLLNVTHATDVSNKLDCETRPCECEIEYFTSSHDQNRNQIERDTHKFSAVNWCVKMQFSIVL